MASIQNAMSALQSPYQVTSDALNAFLGGTGPYSDLYNAINLSTPNSLTTATVSEGSSCVR